MGGGVPYLADGDAFQAALAKTHSGRLLAIDFTATWCGPCKMIGPRFEAMESEFKFVDFAKVDVDDNQETAAQCGIRSMPTFKFYRAGLQIAEFSGADENRLRAILAEHGGPPTLLPPGDSVTLVGLKARPEVNGRRGTVRGFDATKARFAVELKDDADGAAETLALKRDNLVAEMRVALEAPADRDTALPAGLPAGATEGVVRGYDAETHCYLVRPALESGELGTEIAVPVACCRLPDGSRGVICGLQGGVPPKPLRPSRAPTRAADAATPRRVAITPVPDARFCHLPPLRAQRRSTTGRAPSS